MNGRSTRHRGSKVTILVVLLFCGAGSRESTAQVVIREEIDIGTREDSTESFSKKSSVDILPSKSGHLCGYFDPVERLGSGIQPDSGIVFVTKNSSFFASDTLTVRLPTTVATGVAACGQPSITKYIHTAASTEERWWTIGPVLEDDQILLSYRSDRGTLPVDIQSPQQDIWIVTMGDKCAPFTNYIERVVLSMAVVEPDTTLSVTASQASVWPSNLSLGTPYEFSTAFADTLVDEIDIRLFDGCAPIVDHEVMVTAEWIYGSGGHLHESSMDSVPYYGSMGVFTVLSDTTKTGLGFISGTTGADGHLRLSYVPPEFGGGVNIVAEAVIETNVVRDTFRLDVKVQDLIPLPDSTGNDLVGGTCDHHGPRGSEEPNFACKEPDDNHYAIQTTIDMLAEIASQWEADTAASNQPLKINDISLPSGGRFDVCGEWSTCTAANGGHLFHRLGRDVDVRATENTLHWGINLTPKKDAQGNIVYKDGKTILESKPFKAIVLEAGGKPAPQVHGRNHYHLYFY